MSGDGTLYLAEVTARGVEVVRGDGARARLRWGRLARAAPTPDTRLGLIHRAAREIVVERAEAQRRTHESGLARLGWPPGGAGY